MQIHLQNVIPNPLADTQPVKNSVWGNDIIINNKEKIVLNAVSGKGKSTFISFLSGVRSDFTGNILVDNQNITLFSLDDWAKLRQTKIATIYQDLKLFDNLTVEENIIVKNDLTNHFSNDKIKQYISISGLEPIKNKLTKNLSYGQKQRVAIIRALAQPFELLLMDEPFSHLDINNQNIMIDLILKEVDANQAGFILTSLDNAHPIKYDKELYL